MDGNSNSSSRRTTSFTAPNCQPAETATDHFQATSRRPTRGRTVTQRAQVTKLVPEPEVVNIRCPYSWTKPLAPPRAFGPLSRDAGDVARVRWCALCGARLPRDAVAGRRYCDAACRAQAYRERRAAERMFGVAVLLGGALETGDRATVRDLSCLRNGHVRRRRPPPGRRALLGQVQDQGGHEPGTGPRRAVTRPLSGRPGDGSTYWTWR